MCLLLGGVFNATSSKGYQGPGIKWHAALDKWFNVGIGSKLFQSTCDNLSRLDKVKRPTG